MNATKESYVYCLDRYGDVWRYVAAPPSVYREITEADRYDRLTGVWRINESVPIIVSDSWTALTEESAIQLIRKINQKLPQNSSPVEFPPTPDAKAAMLDRIYELFVNSSLSTQVRSFSELASDLHKLYNGSGGATVPNPDVPSVTVSSLNGPTVVVEDYPNPEDPKRRLNSLRLTVGSESAILSRKEVHRLALAFVEFGACGSIGPTQQQVAK